MTRRGSHAVYLDIDHSDIEEFLSIKDVGNPIQSLFYGVSVPDYWMEEMIGGDKEKRNIWAKVLESRKNKGLPYIFFKDNVNKGKPQVYKDLNEEVVQSNLCFYPDTEVITDKGVITMEELFNRFEEGEIDFMIRSSVEGKCKFKWNPIRKVIRTGLRDESIRFKFYTGDVVECTPDHQFLVADLNEGVTKWVEAQEITIDDRIICTLENLGCINPTEISRVKYASKRAVYDIVVDTENDDERNFAVGKEIGVIAHNCTEIALPSHENESFVCCLASLNLAKYNEWKDTDVVSRVVYFLDAVMQDFIDKTENIKHMEDVRRFAMRHRSLGVGT